MADEEICKLILEKILRIQIERIEIIEEQKTINPAFDSKGIRLDVYAKDEKNTVYEVEMQRGRENELPQRMRYYQGAIDLDLIEKGDSYKKLAKSYVIFICTFDYFKMGRHLYTFENVCLEDRNILLCDGTQKIVLTSKGNVEDVDKEMLEFLRYIEKSTAEMAKEAKGALVKKVHEKVESVKGNRKLEVEYMTWGLKYMDILEEGEEAGFKKGEEIGIQKGREEGREEGIAALIDILREMNCEESLIKQKIMDKFKLNSEDAKKYLG